MSNKIDLSGRFAVVTGGAQGIGRAIVERFLASGATVGIWDADKSLADKTAGALKGKGKVAAFDALYAGALGLPSLPATDAMLTMRP
jgi:3-oxoacyl-[acyl-carrier protein] reductase